MTPQLFVDGLHFPEGPRWRGDRLWFSDMHGHRVMTVDTDGQTSEVARLDTRPSGLGWTPDGRLLVVSMVDRRLLHLDGMTWTLVADLAALASFRCNDMVVDAHGRAYVGTFGFDLDGGADYAPGEIIVVEPDGRARVAAVGLRFPNGMVITPDGRTLIAAESMGPALQAFDVAVDGSLAGPRLWAGLTDLVPDGICLDAAGAIWVASPVTSEIARVEEGGRVVQRVPLPSRPFACMLGGSERRTLFVLAADNSNPEYCRAHATGTIATVTVDVPGAGLP